MHIVKPKDLGNPNEFPYKDQIVAEKAEKRRKVSSKGWLSNELTL